MTTNLEAAAEAILEHNKLTAASTHALFALDAIDPRLKLLTPEDTTALLDWMSKYGTYWLRDRGGHSVLPDQRLGGVVVTDPLDMHYTDCGIAGGWPHPASAHDLPAPRPEDRRVLLWQLDTDEYPFVSFTTPKEPRVCPECGRPQ